MQAIIFWRDFLKTLNSFILVWKIIERNPNKIKGVDKRDEKHRLLFLPRIWLHDAECAFCDVRLVPFTSESTENAQNASWENWTPAYISESGQRWLGKLQGRWRPAFRSRYLWNENIHCLRTLIHMHRTTLKLVTISQKLLTSNSIIA